MKKQLSLLFLFLTLLFTSYSQESKQFTAAIGNGDAKSLAQHFDSNIELSIVNEDGLYTKKQAELILQRFFEKHPVISFETKHEGGDLKRSKFLIGELKTNNHLYRCHLLFKKVDEKIQIIELRLELEE